MTGHLRTTVLKHTTDNGTGARRTRSDEPSIRSARYCITAILLSIAARSFRAPYALNVIHTFSARKLLESCGP